MAQSSVTVSREKLYQEVWQTPIHRLAPHYGLSDVGLKKICKKLHVPTPPRGYWMRIKAGEKIRCPPLPPLKYGQPSNHDIQPRRHIEEDLTPEALEQDLQSEIMSAKPIRVPKAFMNPHPLVVQTEKVLSKAKPDDYGALRPWRQEYLNIRVSPASLKRGLRIMDALIKGMEARGFSIKTSTPYKLPETRFVLFNESIEFFLAEKIRRKDHVLTKKEIEEKKRYSYSYVPKWDYEPTGKLSLEIGPYLTTSFRKKWADGTKNRLEDLLDDFVLGAAKIARERQRESRIREEEHRRWMEEQRILEEERKRQEMEQKRLLVLESQADQWAKAGRIRAYVKAVEHEVSDRVELEPFRDQLREWASWAKQHADNIDPVKKLKMVRQGHPNEGDPLSEDCEM